MSVQLPVTSSDVSLQLETSRCLDSLRYLAKYKGTDAARSLLATLQTEASQLGIYHPITQSPYINTIPPDQTPPYPGDLVIERKIEAMVRWNAMAMVVKGNKASDGIGGHISTFASSSTLYEVGFHHFFKGNGDGRTADQVYFQGHASPGIYARGFMEGRLTESQLINFRRELAKGGGLSSYPHPHLMPDYWQFPTVSMGLGPIMAIYQARFNRYLQHRGLLSHDPTVWCFIGDGECDEPETLGALSIASREGLDNLVFVINCNLQRLDGPVRGNGKIIQELEGTFTGAGWEVIKVVWGKEWDALLAGPYRHELIQRMNEVVDGEYQKYIVMPGSYMRTHFFGKTPDLLAAVAHLSDQQLEQLGRGGHEPEKVYAAYARATQRNGKPSVILAKTIKGYGMGEAGEGRNHSHQQKKLGEKEIRHFRDLYHLPISDDEVADLPFIKPTATSVEGRYLKARRQALDGPLPERLGHFPPPPLPDPSFYSEFHAASSAPLSTTMALVRLISKALRDPIKPWLVPIIPDEGRTFGMEAMFRQIGIYSPLGQQYEPVDSESLLAYREAKDGQILEEGINEAGSMASWLAAGTAYATHGLPMIPIYIFYSMFGMQRVGDMVWLAGDSGAKGFLVGGTAGRTTLNGEGLQHQDGHSHVLGSSIPNLVTYDVAFRYEIAVIIEDGLRRMYQQNESIFYYLTVGNENYHHPAMPEGSKEGILRGLYCFKRSGIDGIKVHLFGSGSIMNEVIRAQELLAGYGVSADIWGATNYKRLRIETIAARRQHFLNPTKPKQPSYLEQVLANETGVFFAASDNVRLVPDQIAPYVPGGLYTLGTDGFGRSDSRSALRRFFEVDAETVVAYVLHILAQKGHIGSQVATQALETFQLTPTKSNGIDTMVGKG